MGGGKWIIEILPQLEAATTDEAQRAIWQTAIEREEAAGRTVSLACKMGHLGPPRPSEKDTRAADEESAAQ